MQAHLRAVDTMTASFTQSDRRGRTLTGTLTIRRPGHVRFDYGGSANMLIVGDGHALTFIDYDVGQRQRWPINDSPLSVLLNPDQDLARFARVVQNDAQVLMIEARDTRRREFGTITIAFAKVAGAPGRPEPAGLEHARRAEQPHHGAALQPALQRAGRRHRLPLSRADPARAARLSSGACRLLDALEDLDRDVRIDPLDGHRHLLDLTKRGHRGVRPGDVVEDQEHRLRILQLVKIGQAVAALDQLDPEGRSTRTASAFGPPPLVPARNAVLLVPPPTTGGVARVDTRSSPVASMVCSAIASARTVATLSTMACVIPFICSGEDR